MALLSKGFSLISGGFCRRILARRRRLAEASGLRRQRLEQRRARIVRRARGAHDALDLVAAALGVEGWLGFKYISTPTARELAKVSLHHACLWGDVAEIDRHLERGVDINAPDETIHASPLHWMCLSGIPVEVARQQGGYIKEEKRLKVVWHLIANGADMNQQITDGKSAGSTPLNLARECGDNEVTELLEQHGALT